MDLLRRMGIEHDALESFREPPPVLESPRFVFLSFHFSLSLSINLHSLEAVAKYILDRKPKIVIMAGAGVSTAAGIPDFRTPGSGLYANLQKYNLPFAEAIFTIHFFRQNPEPFFQLAKEMYPGKWKPTTTHYFVKLLEQKGLLLRHFTQNIDTLERVAGISPEKIVEAHGSFGEAHCIECDASFPAEFVEACVMAEPVKVPRCTTCDGIVKPRITFFGESLPARFSQCAPDLKQAELLLVLGTSLKVMPVSGV